MIGVNSMFAPIVVNHLMVTIVRIVVIQKCSINRIRWKREISKSPLNRQGSGITMIVDSYADWH